MRISDWSSDVCSSDLGIDRLHRNRNAGGLRIVLVDQRDLGAERLADLLEIAEHLRLGVEACHRRHHDAGRAPDRKSVVEGKSVSVRVDPGVRRRIKKQNNKIYTKYTTLCYT